MTEPQQHFGLDRFVDALRGPNAAPAGGAVAAAIVAAAASLLVKVGRVSTGANNQGSWRLCRDELIELADQALDLVDRDAKVVTKLMQAMKSAEPKVLEGLWFRASEVPIEVVAVAIKILIAFAPFQTHVKECVAEDCNAAIELLCTGSQISLSNAKSNVAAIKDPRAYENANDLREQRMAELARALSLYDTK